MRNYAVTGDGKERALKDAGASQELIDLAACGLLPHDDLFTHQRDALASALSGKNVVVSTGTGSGKTEAFLLPVLSALVEESRSWTGTSPPGANWWDQDDDDFEEPAAAEKVFLDPVSHDSVKIHFDELRIILQIKKIKRGDALKYILHGVKDPDTDKKIKKVSIECLAK